MRSAHCPPPAALADEFVEGTDEAEPWLSYESTQQFLFVFGSQVGEVPGTVGFTYSVLGGGGGGGGFRWPGDKHFPSLHVLSQ